MYFFMVLILILSLGITILGILIMLKQSLITQFLVIKSPMRGSIAGLGFAILGTLLMWVGLSFLFDLPGKEMSLRISGILVLLLSITSGIASIIGRPLLTKVYSTYSKRQGVFSGIFIIASGVAIAFTTSVRDYFNFAPNDEAVILFGLFVAAVISLILLMFVKFMEIAQP